MWTRNQVGVEWDSGRKCYDAGMQDEAQRTIQNDARTEAGRWEPLAEILACPRCSGPLGAQGSDAAWEPFKCPGCSIVYPVVEGMPILLPANAGDEASAVVFEDQWRMQAEGHFERDTLNGETAEQELQSF